jgi:hypothetical protein
MPRAVALTLGAQTIGMLMLLTTALDLWAHSRVDELGGVNMWGYRGRVLPQKAENEVRIALVGGDFAFGWGQAAGGTIAGALRQQVMLQTDLPGRPLHPVTAVNLSARGLTPAEYDDWIQRFAYLRIDIVCLLPDPRSAGITEGLLLPDRESMLFRAFGYAPILPLFLQEKGEQMDSTFVSGLGAGATWADRTLARASGDSRTSSGTGMETAEAYLTAVERAIGAARHLGAAVTVIAPPQWTDATGRNDVGALRTLAERFRASRVRFVDLGADPELNGPDMYHHGFNLTSAGTARAAEFIAPTVIEQVRALIE